MKLATLTDLFKAAFINIFILTKEQNTMFNVSLKHGLVSQCSYQPYFQMQQAAVFSEKLW